MALLSDRVRGQFVASVVSNHSLCREHYRLTLRVKDFPRSRPGQFVQLACRFDEMSKVEHEFDWQPGERMSIEGDELQGIDAFLRRPFSIAGRREIDGVSEIDLIGREVGPGTRFLSRLEVGQSISILGPLGNTFALPEPGGTALLVGGGVGIPPMIYLAQTLFEHARAADTLPRAIAFAGAMTQALMAVSLEVPFTGDWWPAGSWPRASQRVVPFAQFQVPTILTTDDGTLGIKGYVTDALEGYLNGVGSALSPSRAVIYTCGPEPMMKAVQNIALKRGIQCQIAVERAMACGMGTCQSCCIRVKKDDPSKPPLEGKDWCYRLACTDGPVFQATKLLW